ncbi:MAG: pyridoxamine 5'-phosphate oxidase family protein [Chitinophagaceae bacterium]|jgi:general stress protein 26
MGITQNLGRREGIEKMKSLAEGKVCFLLTHLPDGEIDTRPMSTLEVDEEGIFWYLCRDESNLVEQIKDDSKIDLLVGDNSNNSYLFVKANAIVFRDQEIIDRLWNPIAKAWFEEGKEDPHIRIVKAEPFDAHYMDTQHGKLVSSIKILIAAATGQPMDDGRQGDIKL